MFGQYFLKSLHIVVLIFYIFRYVLNDHVCTINNRFAVIGILYLSRYVQIIEFVDFVR
jgi:hypothetical protein